MARKLNSKEIKQRIKDNKAVMKETKAAVTEALTKGNKGEDIDPVATRASLAMFIKAVTAVNADTEKLAKAE